MYQADASKSNYSDKYGTQTSYKNTEKDSSGKVKSTASAALGTLGLIKLPQLNLHLQ